MAATILTSHPSPEPGVMNAKAPLSIVIPAYNEAEGVEPSMRELFAELEKNLDPDIEFEVIVVDDGSTDGTSEKIAQFEHPKLRVLKHAVNRGYGAALKSGIRHAKHQWIMITDADGTYPNEHVPHLLAERETNEMIVGARIGRVRSIPWIRRPPKWVLRKLASYMSGVTIPDLNSGLRVMRKDVVEKFFNILPNQFSFTSTITIAMLSSGYAVKYLPINYHHRAGNSKIRPIQDTLGFLRLIVRTTMYFDPLRIFLPVAATFMLASIGIGFGSYSMTGRVMDVSTLLLFVTGVHLLGLGMLADASNRRFS